MTEETLNIPLDVVGKVALRFGLTKQGYMISPQAPIDPGYSGKIMMLVYNLSDEYRTLRRGERFVTIYFEQLSGVTAPYRGDNQFGKSITDFMSQNTPIRSSLTKVTEEGEATREKVEKALKRAAESRVQTLLLVLATVLAFTTLIAAVLTIIVTLKPNAAPATNATSGATP
jgi:hypothetical protein